MTDIQEKDYSESEVTETQSETPEKDYSQDEQEETPEVIDKKRHKEIVHWKELETQKARDLAINTVWKYATTTDASILLEVHENDPKLAKAVADKIDWESSEWWSYSNFLKWDAKKVDDDFDTKYEKRRRQEQHEESIKKAHKVIKSLPDEIQDEALSYFEDITEGKTLTEEKALKYAEMASTYVSKDKVKQSKKEDAEKALSSTSLPKWETPSKSKDERVRSTKDRKLILLSSN